MYLYHALSTGLTTWGGSWIVGFFLPIPEFAKTFLTASLYLGIGGYILETFSTTDFYEQLEEMKTIYNWVLKGNGANYSLNIDKANKKLENADIQRMIKCMANFCSTEFMIAWPNVVDSAEEQSGIVSTAFSWGYSMVASPLSLFSSPAKPNPDQLARIREFRANVETRKFDVGVFAGFEQSIRYFFTNPDFKAILSAKVSEPVQNLKNMIPAVLRNN